MYNHLDDQFYVGNDFLVAPILTQSETASPPSTSTAQRVLAGGQQLVRLHGQQLPAGSSYHRRAHSSNRTQPLLTSTHL